MADVAQLVRAPDCDSGGRRFKTGHSPHHFFIMGVLQDEDFLNQFQECRPQESQRTRVCMRI